MGFQPCGVMFGETSKKTRNPDKLITRDGVWNDEYPIVRSVVIEELNGELNEIVPGPSNEASLFPGGKLQLFEVRCTHHSGFMGAQGINPLPPQKTSNFRAEILVQVEFHEGELRKG